MNDIESYIQNNLSLEEFSFQRKKNFQDIKEYYDNAKADAIFCYSTIRKFLNSEKKILYKLFPNSICPYLIFTIKK